MASSTNRKADRHANSINFTVRIDKELLKDFDAKRSLDNKSRRELIIEYIEAYTYGKQRNL